MEITHTIVREVLSYCPETGGLTWLPRRRTLFTTDQQWRAWNTRYAGKTAGRIANDGYRTVSILGGRYQAHRLIWLHVYGCWPNGEIDHINGDPADNRLANLRDVSHQENQRNQRLKSSNTSGFNGVLWDKTTKRWKAYIGGAQRTHVGFFDTPEQAAAARKAAQQQLGFHANHGAQR